MSRKQSEDCWNKIRSPHQPPSSFYHRPQPSCEEDFGGTVEKVGTALSVKAAGDGETHRVTNDMWLGAIINRKLKKKEFRKRAREQQMRSSQHGVKSCGGGRRERWATHGPPRSEPSTTETNKMMRDTLPGRESCWWVARIEISVRALCSI